MHARFLMALSVVLIGCGGSDMVPDSGMPPPDAGFDAGDPGDDAGRDAGPGRDAGNDGGGADAGSMERRTYVVAQLVVPDSAMSAMELGRDLDGNGTPDNQLGSVMAALQSASGLDLQARMDDAVARGRLIVLVEALASTFVDDPSALARMLRGEMPMPAPCESDTDPVCGHHLSGSGSFVATDPAPARVMASIEASLLDAGPSDMSVPLPLGSADPPWVPLVDGHFGGTVSGSGIASGTVTGAVRVSDIDETFLPAIHEMVVAQVEADCPVSCVAGSVGETLLAVFDTAVDGTVTIDELRTSPLITGLLAPDLDLFDGSGLPGTDGVYDSLSLGYGFNAVNGAFAEP